MKSVVLVAGSGEHALVEISGETDANRQERKYRKEK